MEKRGYFLEKQGKCTIFLALSSPAAPVKRSILCFFATGPMLHVCSRDIRSIQSARFFFSIRPAVSRADCGTGYSSWAA